MGRCARCGTGYSNCKGLLFTAMVTITMLCGGAGRPRGEVNPINAQLKLRASKIHTLRLPDTDLNMLETTIPLNGLERTMVLQATSICTDDYRVVIERPDGSRKELTGEAVRTFRGYIEGMPDSSVAATVGPHGLIARILTTDSQFWLEPLAATLPGADPDDYVVYSADDILPEAKTCGATHNQRIEAGVVALERAASGSPCGAGPCVAEIACDADYEFYLAHGSSVANVEAEIHAIINAINIQYERDVDITHLITTIIVRSSSNDPYTSTSASGLLNEFRTHWQNDHADIQRDMTHLFTGKNLDGSTIGIAWFNGVCTSYNYGLSQATFTGNFAYVTDLVAHELGHNWNAGHCSCTSHTMNPYVTGSNVFHPSETIPDIVAYRDSRSCLDAAAPGCTSNADCQDDLFCNGAEICSNGVCLSGAPVTCDDGVACTVDTCNEATDSCTATPNDAACNDGLYCNGTETCNTALGCQNGVAIACSDGIACTVDSCNESTDSCEFVPNHGACSDGAFCNGAEICDPAQGCIAGTPIDCDDGIPCTDNICNEFTDNCEFGANHALCDDGLFCNGAETCGNGACQPGAPPCGELLCNEATDTCAECLSHADCDDGLYCNGAETCSGGNCSPGTAMTCDDGIACTNDLCDDTLDACRFVPNDALCDDGLFCNGAETCTANGCTTGINPCPGQICAEVFDVCIDCIQNSDCDDGLFCNGAETCDTQGHCLAGTPVECDDGAECTDDSCDEDTDTCAHVSNDAHCDDGLFCNGHETCADGACVLGEEPCSDLLCDEQQDACVECMVDAHCDDALFCNGVETCVSGMCQAGAQVACDDRVDCTVDQCDEQNDTCVHVADDSACNDGLFCNGAESCVDGTCTAGADPCPGRSCDESSDACVECMTDADCSDGLFCNGAETCDDQGACQPGAAVVCDDEVPCTVDACDDQSAACTHTPDDDACDDGQFCNGLETCDASGCLPGVPPCADQVCDEAADTCVDCLTDEACDDGLFCNGLETCGAQGTCQAGSPPVCDDADPCTTDSCDESSKSCTFIADASACDDGLFCNGLEACVDGACQTGTPPCAQGCDEAHDICLQCGVDADCDDGLMCNGIETCDATGACRAGEAVHCDDGIACTEDRCDEDAGGCVTAFLDAQCDDGLYCNGLESCTPDGCTAGAPPCDGGPCNEQEDACVGCLTAADCDDGLFCNGPETCSAGACASGPAPCSDLQCNERTDACVECMHAEDCDDGLFCNGLEACADGSCVAGVEPCPQDHCNEALDACAIPQCNADGVCDPGEDCALCPDDCASGRRAECGNGVCEINNGESCTSCPDDCRGRLFGGRFRQFCCGGNGPTGVDCTDPRCSSGSLECAADVASEFCCGDGSCDPGEDGWSCTVDCGPPPFCGDGVCAGAESTCTCPDDCGLPLRIETFCDDGIDDDCDGAIDCADADCLGLPGCGCNDDGICDEDEDCMSCPEDCRLRAGATCGNNVCEIADGEDCLSCPQDCNGRQRGRDAFKFCCGDGAGVNPIDCSDWRCAARGNSCADEPAEPACCGDGLCADAENVVNCPVDCE